MIEHRTQNVSSVARRLTHRRGVDVVFEHVGAETGNGSLLCLKRGGRLVTCGATSGFDPKEDIRHIFYRQLEILGSTMGSYKEFRDVHRLYLAGRLRPVVDRVFPMANVAEAHRVMESRSFFGKLVVSIG